jgi:hypothetical protein
MIWLRGSALWGKVVSLPGSWVDSVADAGPAGLTNGQLWARMTYRRTCDGLCPAAYVPSPTWRSDNSALVVVYARSFNPPTSVWLTTSMLAGVR